MKNFLFLWPFALKDLIERLWSLENFFRYLNLYLNKYDTQDVEIIEWSLTHYHTITI